MSWKILTSTVWDGRYALETKLVKERVTGICRNNIEKLFKEVDFIPSEMIKFQFKQALMNMCESISYPRYIHNQIIDNYNAATGKEISHHSYKFIEVFSRTAEDEYATLCDLKKKGKLSERDARDLASFERVPPKEWMTSKHSQMTMIKAAYDAWILPGLEENDFYDFGDTIKITCMRDEPQYTGKTGVIDGINHMGMLFGTWGGCGIIPDRDCFEVIKKKEDK